MKFAIIAAGEGSRLAQEGVELPKPLVRLNGEPMIERLIRIFRECGADSISIIVNTLHPQTEAFVRELISSGKAGVPITLVVKSTPSSMHSFSELAPSLRGDEFCLTTVDTIFREDDFKAYIEAFRQSKTDGMMAVTDYIDDEKPLYVATDADMNITGFLDKAEDCRYISGGIYCLRPKALDTLQRCMDEGQSRMRNFQRGLVADGLQLKAMCFSKILDVDHASDIAKAEAFLAENKETDICCIGHITKDKIVTPKSEVYMPGGASFYFSHGINHMANKKVSYKLITSLAEEDMKAVDDLRQAGVDTEVIPSRCTVYFENIYGENQDNRRQRVLAKADPFTINNLQNVKAKYIVLGSLLADDFSTDVIRFLSTRGTLVVDAQGYLREVREQQVHAIDWQDKLEALKYIDILKVNEYEAEVLTGKKDLHEAAKQLAEWGVKEVLLTLGSYGSIILANGTFYDIPAYEPLEVVDATGCGDTFVMGYVYKRVQGCTPQQAAHFAAAVSTIKLQKSGPFSATEAEAYARIPKQLRSQPEE